MKTARFKLLVTDVTTVEMVRGAWRNLGKVIFIFGTVVKCANYLSLPPGGKWAKTGRLMTF